MKTLLTPRRLVFAYSLGGLLAGIGFAGWYSWNDLGKYFIHQDGSVNKSSVQRESWTQSVMGNEYPVDTPGRPLTFWEKISLGIWEALPLLISSAGVGLFWGLTHLKIREAITDPFGDENKLDYEDSTAQNRPPGST